ncbi:MAG: epimerase [Ferruginibacter sp.]
MQENLNIIITGASGMVGEAVLMECLQADEVQKILVVGRRSCGIQHTKLKEILHPNFFDLSSIENRLAGYNACLFCLGVSSIGMKEVKYRKFTYDLTLLFAQTVLKENNEMSFCYISGAGTDSSEMGRQMLARVKGKTENDLKKLPFKAEYNFRPGLLIPTAGQKHVLIAYKYLGWMASIIKILSPSSICTLRQLGKAMIHAVSRGYEKNILEVKDIKKLA